jgi:hypothetical protein
VIHKEDFAAAQEPIPKGRRPEAITMHANPLTRSSAKAENILFGACERFSAAVQGSQ